MVREALNEVPAPKKKGRQEECHHHAEEHHEPPRGAPGYPTKRSLALPSSRNQGQGYGHERRDELGSGADAQGGPGRDERRRARRAAAAESWAAAEGSCRRQRQGHDRVVAGHGDGVEEKRPRRKDRGREEGPGPP